MDGWMDEWMEKRVVDKMMNDELMGRWMNE